MLCAGSRWTGEAGQLLWCQSWAAVTSSLLLKPSHVLLQSGMFCDASAANVRHSLTAGDARAESVINTFSYFFAVLLLHGFSKASSQIRNSSFTLSPSVLHILKSTCWKTTAKIHLPSNYRNSSESECSIAVSFSHLQIASGINAWFCLFIFTFPLDLFPPHF